MMQPSLPSTLPTFRKRWLLAALASCAAAGAPAADQDTRHFDLIIRGGEIVDGTGAARNRADVAINADEIVAVGQFANATADRIIDARDRIVAPGFIDMHAHVLDDENAATGLLSADVRRRAAQNFVAQGITTAVTNPDGAQSMPLSTLRQRLQRGGFGLNVIMMNGHSGLRALAMKGDVKRAANALEIRRMQEMLRHDLAQGGSFGMSLGIEYDPARYSSSEEQLALGRVLGEYSAVFIPHLRSQGIAPMWYRPSENKGQEPPTLDDAIDETLRVAETTGATVVFTHMKAWGPGYRGEAPRIIARLQAVRDRGARIYMDVYPYDSSASDGAFVAIPPWAFAAPPKADPLDYRAALESSLAAADETRRADLAADVRAQIALKGGAENIRVLAFPEQDYIGMSYADLMRLRGLDEVQLAIALQREGDPHVPGGARMRSFSMAESDIESFYRLDWCAVSTDGWIVLPEEAAGDLKYEHTNRRLFGSYPRRLAHYALARQVDTVEHAVRSMTGLPAQILNLNDRGRVAVGLKADIVVLDLKTLRDNTTFLEPSAYPSGVQYVLINGKLAVDDGKRTLALVGRVLQPAGRRRATHNRR
jgi:N-acyl-D-amino-acid deacylase